MITRLNRSGYPTDEHKSGEPATQVAFMPQSFTQVVVDRIELLFGNLALGVTCL